MIKVFLREKKLKHGKRGLYLDFYPPIVIDGVRTRREHLRLYVYEKPKTETEKDHNRETRMLGENIRSQRQLELQSGAYGFVSSRQKRKDFIAYFKEICENKRKTSESNFKFWRTILKHLKDFTADRGAVTFSSITESFCREFRDYLLYEADLAQNTAAAYFNNFKTVINNLSDKKLFPKNPVEDIKSIEAEETEREFLTLEELQRLAQTPTKCEALKKASLFSALTGLRFSDIEKLTWGEVRHSEAQGHYIRFRQKKTKGAETLPISEEAFELAGARLGADEKVFRDLRRWHCTHFLPGWITDAGIDRHITFHCFRHTFATLQLTLGSDIVVVQKMLGHRKLETTQVYAKIIDQRKREAANKISLK